MRSNKFFLLFLYIVISLSLSAQVVTTSSLPPAGTLSKETNQFVPEVRIVADPQVISTSKIVPKPYREVVTVDAQTKAGIITIHKVKDRYLFEVSDSLLNRDILFFTRISKSAAGTGKDDVIGFAGYEVNKIICRFELAPLNKIILRRVNYDNRENSETDNTIRLALKNSNSFLLIASFDINAQSEDHHSNVIDLTDFFAKDNDQLFFNRKTKSNLEILELKGDRSYVDDFNSSKDFAAIKTSKTFSRKNNEFATYEFTTFIVPLSVRPMLMRDFDQRIGYNNINYYAFGAEMQNTKEKKIITKWRLEPKDTDSIKYRRGELVEPAKPIVFYIDSTTPKKWIPFIIQGVIDWQPAFEHAGFRNAIVVRQKSNPSQVWQNEGKSIDIIFRPMLYKPFRNDGSTATIEENTNPNIIDDRSGEIVESGISLDYYVIEALKRKYIVATGGTDPAASTLQLPDTLVGKLVRYWACHQAGHALGLKDNLGATSRVSISELRTPTFLKKFSLSPSIMDEPGFNYVAQPEDQISQNDLIPRLGDYDKWAIEWAYRWYEGSQVDKKTKLNINQVVLTNMASNPMLWYGEAGDLFDPRKQGGDMGNDPIAAGKYGIKNLQRVVNLIAAARQNNVENEEQLKGIYLELLNQYLNLLRYTTKNIGGIMTTFKTVDQPGDVIAFVPKSAQRQAIKFLTDQLFTTPYWLFDKKLFSFQEDNSLSVLQYIILKTILSANTLNNLNKYEMYDGDSAYSVVALFNDLKKAVWGDMRTVSARDINKRNLQKTYIAVLAELAIVPANAGQASNNASSVLSKRTDVPAIVKSHIEKLIKEINEALQFRKEERIQFHLQDCEDRFKALLEKISKAKQS
jgi:hypothetical protein